MKLELKLSNKWLEATWYTEENETKAQVHCESFSGHPEHIAMLRAKAIEYETVLDEAIVSELIAGYVPPVLPTEEELLIEKRAGMVVTMRQARLALLEVGLLATIETAIASGTDEALKIEWEYAMDVKRTWTSLIALATSLGMTETQLDDLFALAMTK